MIVSVSVVSGSSAAGISLEEASAAVPTSDAVISEPAADVSDKALPWDSAEVPALEPGTAAGQQGQDKHNGQSECNSFFHVTASILN